MNLFFGLFGRDREAGAEDSYLGVYLSSLLTVRLALYLLLHILLNNNKISDSCQSGFKTLIKLTDLQ